MLLLAVTISGAPWRFANPRPHGNNVLEMLYRDGVVWQVGERGSIYTSSDLDLWIPQSSGTTRSLRSITSFGTNVFISGEEGTILSGPNPRELNIRSLDTTDWLEGICASSNAIVAVGDNGAIYSSTDGANWNRRGSFSTWLRSVAYGNQQFITVGEDGFIATSTDGQSWEQRPSGTTAHLNRISWLNDRFWIVGDRGTVLTNSSQSTFSPVNVAVTNSLFTASANTNEVVIAGDGVVLMGPSDGSAWTRQSDPQTPLLAPEWPYYTSVWDGRLFLFSGQAGMLVEGFRTNDTAPLNWYSTFQPTRSWLWAVKRATDFYAAVGVNGTIATSEDGVDWRREVIPETVLDRVLLGIGGNTNQLIAVGNSGAILRSMNALTTVVTTNSTGQAETNLVNLFGVNWQQIASLVTNDLQGVAASRTTIVITGGNGTILTSSGPSMGTVWLPQSSGVTTFLSGVTEFSAGFIAVGAAGVILTSNNGTMWTRRESGVESWIYAVRNVGGQLIAVGENGLILTSTDGVEWQRRESGTDVWLNDITFAQGTWYATGGNGTLVTSTDAITWRPERAITARSLYGAATDGEQLVTVGMDGVILRRNLQTPTTPVHIESYDNPGLRSIFLFTGQIDQRFVIEESESILGPWRAAEYLELTDPAIIFERNNPEVPTKFFRTKLE